VGAGSLAKAVGQAALMLDVLASSRASSLPQEDSVGRRGTCNAEQICGSELARDGGVSVSANVECQSAIASKLPQGIGVRPWHPGRLH